MNTSPKPKSSSSRRRRKNNEESLNAAIEVIYEAATDVSLWNKALDGIVQFVGNSGSHLAFIDETTGLITPDVHFGMPPDMLAEYNGEKVTTCPRIQSARRQPLGTLCYDYQHISEREMDLNEYYHWLQTEGDAIRYYLATRLDILGGSEAWLSMAFRRQEGHAQNDHMHRFRTILPHVNRAIRISQRLGTWELACSSTLASLNTIDVGTFIIGRDGKVLHLNTVAEGLVRNGSVFRLSGARLQLAGHGSQRELSALIDSARAPGAGPTVTRGGSLVVKSRFSDEVYKVTAAPLRMQSGSLAFVPTTAVVFVERIRGAAPDPETLRRRYGLTPAECRIAARLAEGLSIASAAAVLNVSLNTARSHLKSILRKTGANRQAALVRVLLAP